MKTFREIDRRVRMAHDVFVRAAHAVAEQADASPQALKAAAAKLAVAKAELDDACKEAKEFMEQNAMDDPLSALIAMMVGQESVRTAS